MYQSRQTSALGELETKPEAEPEEVIDEDAEEGTIFMTDDNGEVIRPSSRSSVRRVSNEISKMSLEKKKIISDICFGGLLKLPQLNKVDRGFTFWLLNHVDCSGSKFVVNGRDDIKMEAADVERILGIPRGGNPVCGLGTDDPEKKFHFIQYSIGAEEDEANSLLAARMNVEEEYEESMTAREISCFKVSFVVYAIGYFLAPTTKANHGSSSFWGALLDPESISSFNWCQYVLDMLIDSAKKGQADMQTKKKCSNVTGCPLLLQMIFLDKINLGAFNHPLAIRPRVSGLTCELMRKMVRASIVTNGSSIVSHEQRNTGRYTCSDSAIGKRREYRKSLTSMKTPCNNTVGLRSLPLKANVNYNPGSSSTGGAAALGEGFRGYLPPNPLGDFIKSIPPGKFSTKQLTALKLFNARILLYTNNFKNFKMQIQNDTVSLVRKLAFDVQTESSVSNQSEPLLSKKRVAEVYGSDGEAGSEASSCPRIVRLNKRYSYETPQIAGTELDNKSYNYISMLDCSSVYIHHFVEHVGHATRIKRFNSTKEKEPTTELLLSTPGCPSKVNFLKAEHKANVECSFVTPIHPMTKLTIWTPKLKNTEDSMFETPAHPIKELTAAPSPTTNGDIVLDSTETPIKCSTGGVPPSSPNTVTKLFNEAALFARLINAEEGINLNARDAQCDFTSSPLVKRLVTDSDSGMAKSPWVYGIQHPRHEEEKTAPFVDWIISADIQMLDSIWIMHSSPRYIEMTGKELKDIFFCGTQMSYDAVDLSVRRLRQLDCKMCRISNTPRWRHMLESDFGVICLAGEDPIQSKSIREQFIGDIIDYNISSCRMIVIPVRATSNWCCYFWDFKNNIVHVVDPLHDGSTISEESHVATIGILQKCLLTCMQTFFDGWYHSFDGWNNEFIILPKQANGRISRSI